MEYQKFLNKKELIFTPVGFEPTMKISSILYPYERDIVIWALRKGRGFEKYIGEKSEPKQEKKDQANINKYSHTVWQRYASPVWMDINQSDTLNFRAARENKDERHICPLQLQTIARCLELWTNKGDIVLSPFAGIGSEGFVSLQKNRKFIGVELKESYYNSCLKNLKIANNHINKFDL